MKYNHKDLELVQSYCFKNIKEMVQDIKDEIYGLRVFEAISIYTTIDNLKEIIKELYYSNIINFDDILYLDSLKKYDEKVILSINYAQKIDLENMYYDNYKNCKLTDSIINYVDGSTCTNNELTHLKCNNQEILLYEIEYDKQ